MAVLTVTAAPHTAQAQRNIPQDAKASCTVTKAEFSKWFAGGAVTANGWVDPADSVAFPSVNTKCDFYKWSWQMFLWLNSPDKNGGGLVFDSNQFYDVSPSVKGVRTLLPNTSISSFGLRAQKGDEIGETGQAGGGGVLISQPHGETPGSLVYYGIHVNDVYAYFLTGQKNKALKPAATTFPASAADLAAVVDFAKPKKLVDASALTLELKTSWVKVDTLKEPDSYIQITAEVPTYTPSADNKTWTLDKASETTKLALVGMHVVGTLAGHPEFCWATFEHINNAPDAPYYYTKSDGTMGMKGYDSSGDWVFMKNGGAQAGSNTELASVDSSTGNIVGAGSSQIGPSNTSRTNPWGNLGNDKASAADNTDVISINNSVRALLATGDLRKNYVLGGALWTKNGGIPGVAKDPVQKGSLTLANSTMETYHQSINCFVCHSGPSFEAFSLSHIYSEIKQLPSKKKKRKK